MGAPRAEHGFPGSYLQLFQGFPEKGRCFPGGVVHAEDLCENARDNLGKKLSGPRYDTVPPAEDARSVGKLHFHYRVGFLEEEHLRVARDEISHHLHRKRVGGADLEHRHVLPAPPLQDVADHGEAHTGSHDAQDALLTGGNFVVVLPELALEGGPDLLDLGVQPGMVHLHAGGKADPPGGFLLELHLPLRRAELSEFNVLAAVVHPHAGTEHGDDAEPLGQVEGVEDHLLRLGGGTGVETGHLGEHGEIAAVLFRLGAVGPRIVCDHEEHAPLELEMGGAHEGIGRNVQPHLLHDGAGAGAGKGGSGGHLEGHLFVHAPLDRHG